MPPTTLTPPQRKQALNALDLANAIRSKRAQLKRDIAAGEVALTQILVDPPAYAEKARVHDMLLSAPGVGAVRANRILNRCRMGPNRTLGTLTDRQRSDLVSEFDSRRPR
jgi:hypothetical protein